MAVNEARSRQRHRQPSTAGLFFANYAAAATEEPKHISLPHLPSSVLKASEYVVPSPFSETDAPTGPRQLTVMVERFAPPCMQQ